jgi:hypothetical protein
MADTLTPADFRSLEAPLQVEVPAAGGPMTLELAVASVEELPPHRLRPQPFSLILRGARERPLVQGTYALRHPRLGRIDVFLVPIAPDAGGARYEATFN